MKKLAQDIKETMKKQSVDEINMLNELLPLFPNCQGKLISDLALALESLSNNFTVTEFLKDK